MSLRQVGVHKYTGPSDVTMGKIRAFRISVPADIIYYPGDTIHGCCELEVTGEIGLKALNITLRGVSKVHWTESRNIGARLGPYTQHFMSGSEYIKEKKTLLQPRFGADRVTLREGRHEFPFVFIIPTGTMPSSFEGKYGSIRYWLRADTNRVRYGQNKAKRVITFVNPLNVALHEYEEPVVSYADKTLCCGFCTGGLISITAHTDKAGYTPGDIINISGVFENFTSRRVHPRASLYQRQYYYANERQKMRTIRLVKFDGSPLSSKCNSTWTNERLMIPNITPSILNCSILKLVYFVKISLKIPGSIKLSTMLPITLGSNRIASGLQNIAGSPLQMLILPPYQEPSELPAYDNNTSSDDEDYIHPPNSRTQTPPPCYSDIFDTDDSDESEDAEVNPEQVVTNL